MADGVPFEAWRPQSHDRMIGMGVRDDAAEDRLAFTVRVACVDDGVAFPRADQAVDDPVLTGGAVGLRYLPPPSGVWVDGQGFEIPAFPASVLVFIGRHEIDEMPLRPCDDAVLATNMPVLFRSPADRLCDCACHAVFFRDDQSHGCSP